jgi:membrane fusion protein, multidrug efflux system
MNIRQFSIVIALLILLGSGAASFYFSEQKEEPEAKKLIKAKKYVKTAPVIYSDIKTNVLAYGRVQASEHLDLLSEVSGRMFEGKIRLKAGEKFTKGTLLFYVDDTEAQLTLKSQKSNFLRDIAAILPDFKVDYSTSFENWSSYFSSIDIDKQLPAMPKPKSEKEKTFLATKGIYSNFYSIKSAEARLEKYRYYAPFDGSVTEVVMQTGAFINPGTRIGKIMKTGALELKVAVETKDVAWIQSGSPASIWSEEAQLNLEGSVVRISDYVNQNTQSVDVYIRLDSKGNKIFDGQFMQASIPARMVKNGMIIPRNAIYNGNEVFVLEDTLLKVRSVIINRLLPEEAIISGLEPNADLVMEQLVSAHNNMKAYKLDRKEIDYETGSEAKKSTPEAPISTKKD